ncbi:hypothetical protein DF16_orf05627 [Bacillus thuringiensis serovar kurstaki str. YBT-1520]|nr:hypothetical protein DF16_orf05627 [Bacillus thuringiensis serovar kurstaki str. YBT-1520]
MIALSKWNKNSEKGFLFIIKASIQMVNNLKNNIIRSIIFILFILFMVVNLNF